MSIDLNCLYLGPKLSRHTTQNYFNEQKNSSIKDFIDTYLDKSPQEVFDLQQKISKLHAKYEMNFQVRDPSGLYSKVVATPFHGFAPLPTEYIKSLVQSTQPILKLTRTLLQNLYSAKKLSIEALGLNDMKKEDQEELLSIVHNNIYYEPRYHHSSFKDYPFLSVVGFDSAVQNLHKPEHCFFELNAGTPCGIEDQQQLYQHFKTASPELFSLIDPFIPDDQSHMLLKQTIDSCAKFWTEQTGISVVLSPGPYNPAHPEIANLALKSGMPLVKMQDLYIDHDGYLRLITTGVHPRITGIYNRKEESFLTYSQDLKIPLRSPFTQINEKLSNELELDLKNGILYSYQYDQNNQIIGVDTDECGTAKYQILFDSISADPQTGKIGNIMDAVWSKKLFISNLGGRVFDDKRAFRILADYLESKSLDSIAHPPKSIRPHELENYIDNAVVKAPDLSGGAGVTIMAQLKTEEQIKVLKDVQARPNYFEIQEMTKLAVIHSYHHNDSGIDVRPLPVDWRLIIFFNDLGQVSSSTHSCLVRTAPFGSLKTNTSSGGGYALALIYENTKINKQHHSAPKVNKHFVGLSRQNQFKIFLKNLKDCESSDQIENLIYEFRDLIDLIGEENIPFLQVMRSFQQGELSFHAFHNEAASFLDSMSLIAF